MEAKAAAKLEDLVRQALERGASDVHVKADSPPLLRIMGELYAMENELTLSVQQAAELAVSILTEEQKDIFRNERELDLAYEFPGLTRVRANFLWQRGKVSAVLRLVPSTIRTIDDLNLPIVLKELSIRPRGLMLVTGPAGCGKSTTQAAMLDYINCNLPVHVMTVEDPVEFLHLDRLAIINQREVGADTNSFHAALKYVLRQDPDVILVGEMRTLETISMAITAAETGHLVIGTLHTPDAVRAIDRIIDAFPPHQQNQIRIQLANNLIGVVSQRLLPRSDRPGMVGVYEVLVAIPAIKGLIREGKSHQIRSQLHMGSKYGMHSMEQHMSVLITQGIISKETALAASPHPEELSRFISGVRQGVSVSTPAPDASTSAETQQLPRR